MSTVENQLTKSKELLKKAVDSFKGQPKTNYQWEVIAEIEEFLKNDD